MTASALELLVDRQAVVDVLLRYASCLDAGEPDRLTEVFATEVDVDYGYGPLSTVHDVIAWIELELPKFDATCHAISNFVIDLKGNRASSRSLVQAWHWRRSDEPHDSPGYVVTGVYDDDLARLPEGWRIVKRRFGLLGCGALGAAGIPGLELPGG